MLLDIALSCRILAGQFKPGHLLWLMSAFKVKVNNSSNKLENIFPALTLFFFVQRLTTTHHKL